MMNKRIQKLFNEAGFHQPEMERLGIEDKFEKFAKLIVKECIYRVRSRQQFAGEDQQNVTQAFDLLVYDLESHFGVEE
jgi:hypothetical protein